MTSQPSQNDRYVVDIDLTGSNCGPDYLSVRCIVRWPDKTSQQRLRKLAAEHYAIPVAQVGIPRPVTDADMEDAA